MTTLSPGPPGLFRAHARGCIPPGKAAAGALARACVRVWGMTNRHPRDLVPLCRAAECHAGAGFPAQDVTRVRACLDAESPRVSGGDDIVPIVWSSGCQH